MEETRTSVAAEEVELFSSLADSWWDPAGAFRVLHALGPSRLTYARTQAERAFGAAVWGKKLAALDVGCGGGVVTEVLAREGLSVMGIDASAPSIAVAQAHAQASGLDISYRTASIEEIAREDAVFDLVVAFEILEHVADVDSFLTALAHVVAPGGLVLLSSMNRTLRSAVLGIGMAEYVLGWIPPGTHRWRQFIKPSELTTHLHQVGLTPVDMTGLVFDLHKKNFCLRKGQVDMEYLMAARKISR